MILSQFRKAKFITKLQSSLLNCCKNVCRWISLPRWLSWWDHHRPTYATAPEMVITCTPTFMFGCTSNVWVPPPKLVVHPHGPTENKQWPSERGVITTEGTNSTQVFVYHFIKLKSTYDVNMGWERIIPLKIYCHFNTSRRHYEIFLLKIVMLVSKPVKITIIYTCTTLMWNCSSHRKRIRLS